MTSYDINRLFTYQNDYVSLDIQIIPLQEHNEQGPAPKAIFLDRHRDELFRMPREAVHS